MSCEAQLAFGIKLTRKECIAILEKLEIEPQEYCPEEQLAGIHDLDCEMFGDATHRPDDKIWFVIGPSQLNFSSGFGGADAHASILADMKDCYALKEMLAKLEDIMDELDLNPDPEWYLDTLWC